MKTPEIYAGADSKTTSAAIAPVFVGYTEKATRRSKSLVNKPVRVSSMSKYRHIFGAAPANCFELSLKPGEDAAIDILAEDETRLAGQDPSLQLISQAFLMYCAVEEYFRNGGDACFIVSVGDYSKSLEADYLIHGITASGRMHEPTMLIVPDAVLLSSQHDCDRVQAAAIKQCEQLGNRIAILDDYQRYHSTCANVEMYTNTQLEQKTADLFRDDATPPVTPGGDYGFLNISQGSRSLLQAILLEEIRSHYKSGSARSREVASLVKKIDAKNRTAEEREHPRFEARLNQSLKAQSPTFLYLMQEIKSHVDALVPKNALTRIYSSTAVNDASWDEVITTTETERTVVLEVD